MAVHLTLPSLAVERIAPAPTTAVGSILGIGHGKVKRVGMALHDYVSMIGGARVFAMDTQASDRTPDTGQRADGFLSAQSAAETLGVNGQRAYDPPCHRAG